MCLASLYKRRKPLPCQFRLWLGEPVKLVNLVKFTVQARRVFFTSFFTFSNPEGYKYDSKKFDPEVRKCFWLSNFTDFIVKNVQRISLIYLSLYFYHSLLPKSSGSGMSVNLARSKIRPLNISFLFHHGYTVQYVALRGKLGRQGHIWPW